MCMSKKEIIVLLAALGVIFILKLFGLFDNFMKAFESGL